MTHLPHAGCSCADYSTSRRSVLRGLGLAAGAGTVTGLSEGIFRQVSYAATPSPSNILIVLSLRGGADGLSMVVPYGDPAYARARPGIAVPRGRLLAPDGFFGLHPSFAPLLPMWRQGRMAAVQAVGLPMPNRSHFAAMEAVEDADPGSSARTGWLNRMVGLTASDAPTEAVAMGTSMVSTSLFGTEPTLGIRQTSTIGLPGAKSGPQAAWKRRSLDAMWRGPQDPLGMAGTSALDASRQLAPLARTQPQPAAGANYPGTPLGRVMQDTARLVKAGVGVRAVTVDYGSWDMHVGVGNLDYGLMSPMISDMSAAIAALFTDLGTLAARVTLVTLSEFGRRVGENANAGLDHGHGNTMLVAGGGVRGGRVFGRWPGLDRGDLVNGDLAVTRDYRSVLSEIVRARMSTNVGTVFPGFRPETPLGFMA